MSQKIEIASSFECVVEKPDAGWIGTSSEKKTPFIRVPLRVSEGPYAGQTIVYSGWLSDKAFDRTIQALAKAFRFDGDIYALTVGKSTLAGKPCNITTEIETYEGKERARVAWLNPPGGAGAKPLDEADLKSIVNKLNSRAKAVAKAAIADKPKGDGMFPDDDIPM